MAGEKIKAPDAQADELKSDVVVLENAGNPISMPADRLYIEKGTTVISAVPGDPLTGRPDVSARERWERAVRSSRDVKRALKDGLLREVAKA